MSNFPGPFWYLPFGEGDKREKRTLKLIERVKTYFLQNP
jgi:hypothetical protein